MVGAWPPPPGVTPNFESPDSIAWMVITAALVSPIVAVFFVLMRSYTKKCIFNRFDWDDYAVVVALLFASAYSVLQVIRKRSRNGTSRTPAKVYL